MRLITAWDDGELKTLSIETWAKRRGERVKYYQQRLRNGYTDDEAINLPKKVQPANAMRRKKDKQIRNDTNFTQVRDKLWKRFVTGQFNNQGLA